MRRNSQAHRFTGFTLLELLVVIAIIAILLAILVPAVQKVRDSAARMQCQNNLKQQVLALHSFHGAHKSMPPYYGVYPSSGPTWSSSTSSLVRGGWFVFLLPFLDQGPLFSQIEDEIKASGYNVAVTIGATSTPSPVTTSTVVINGITYSYSSGGSTSTGGTASNHGIWEPSVRQTIFAVTHCPSDPSLGSGGLVSGWGGTNYLANYNVMADSLGDGTSTYDSGAPSWITNNLGYYAPASSFPRVSDGLSNTIFLAEGYAMCNGLARIALHSANNHNFGLTSSLPNVTVPASAPPTSLLPSGSYNFSYGMPNTFLFQVRPLTTACSRWQAQTPHITMNVAVMDGSVRAVQGSVSQDTWSRLLLPRDGQPVAFD